LITDLKTRGYIFTIKNTFACLSSSKQDVQQILAKGGDSLTNHLLPSVLSTLRSFVKDSSLGFLSLMVIPFTGVGIPTMTMFKALPTLLNEGSVSLDVGKLTKRVLSPSINPIAEDIYPSVKPMIDTFVSM